MNRIRVRQRTQHSDAVEPLRRPRQNLANADPDLDRTLQLASVKATLPVFAAPSGRPFGWMEPSAWQSYGTWMFDNKLLDHPPNAAQALTDEFLPGQGLADTGDG